MGAWFRWLVDSLFDLLTSASAYLADFVRAQLVACLALMPASWVPDYTPILAWFDVANYWFPVSEVLALWQAWIVFIVAFNVLKIVRRCIPTAG